MALILYRYAAKDADKAEKTAFSDIDALSEESIAAIEWALAKGLITV